MMMHKCDNCDGYFEEAELRHETVSDPFATGDSWHYEIEVFCPKCGSDSIGEVSMCAVCDKVEAAEGLDECQACFDKIEQEEYTSHTCEGMDGDNGNV